MITTDKRNAGLQAACDAYNLANDDTAAVAAFNKEAAAFNAEVDKYNATKPKFDDERQHKEFRTASVPKTAEQYWAWVVSHYTGDETEQELYDRACDSYCAQYGLPVEPKPEPAP